MVINLLSFSNSLTLARFLHWSKYLSGKRRRQLRSSNAHVNKLVLTGFVHCLIRMHRQKCGTEENNTVCDKSVTRIHNSLYTALRMCFELNIRSSEVVSELIREIFQCEGSLHSIFSIMAISQTSPRGNPIPNVNNVHTILLYPGADNSRFDEVKPALTYYLKNLIPLPSNEKGSNQILQKFLPSQILNDTINDGEIVTPLMAATMRKEPDVVLTLLQYGADPLVLSGDEDSNAQNPIHYIINCLNSISVIKNYTWLQAQKDVASEEEKALEIFGYLSRAVLRIDVRETVTLELKTEDDDREPQYYSAHPRLAEKIDLSEFRNPPHLHHICRYTIRQVINTAAKNTIPESIKLLPLPVPLQNYLDLKS